MKVDHSGYVWLLPSKETTAEVVANALITWFSTFGIVTQWVSDRVIHIENKLIKILRQSLETSHHFPLAYCP